MGLARQIRNVTPVTRPEERNVTPVTQRPSLDCLPAFEVQERARAAGIKPGAHVDVAGLVVALAVRVAKLEALVASRPERSGRAEYMRAYRAKRKAAGL